MVEAPFGLRPLVARLAAVRLVRDQRVAEVDGGLPVVLDQQVGLADGVVGGRQLLPVNGDVLLDVAPFRRRWRRGRAGAPSPPTACRRCRRPGRRSTGAGPGWDVEQFDHQADDFARREVLPGLLAALFREAPQQFLVDVAHFQRRELVGAEGELLVLVEDRRQPVVLHHQRDGGAVIEVLDDVVDVLREAVDVGAEVSSSSAWSSS
jgi:hypothetical protein